MSILDLTTVEESGIKLHPIGEFTATCTEAELKDTKSGTGKFIEIKLVSSEGIVWHNFNIFNDNNKAQDIGRGQLKSFLKFAGADSNSFDMNNIRALEGLKTNIVVKHEEREGWGKSAKVSYFKAVKEINNKPDNNIMF